MLVTKKEFEKFKSEIIGKPVNPSFGGLLDCLFSSGYGYLGEKKNETIHELIEKVNTKLCELEKYLKIEYVKEEKKFEGYKPKKTNK